jgi:DNA-dependent protein kinase catalytic subunit
MVFVLVPLHILIYLTNYSLRIAIVAYKLLVFTSSDISQSLAELFNGGRQPTSPENTPHSYAIYLFLWRNLFKPNALSKDLKKRHYELPDDDQERLLQIIYGSTMESFKRLVSLLNLSVSDIEVSADNEPVDEDESMPTSRLLDTDTSMELASMVPSSGDVAKMQANCAKDFVIFQNLTEFWQLFLPEIRPDLFGRWTYVIGKTLIELSERHPLVSGFYKMFAACLQVSQNTSFFKSRATPNHDVKVKPTGSV